jgi:hypothetical protein
MTARLVAMVVLPQPPFAAKTVTTRPWPFASCGRHPKTPRDTSVERLQASAIALTSSGDTTSRTPARSAAPSTSTSICLRSRTIPRAGRVARWSVAKVNASSIGTSAPMTTSTSSGRCVSTSAS